MDKPANRKQNWDLALAVATPIIIFIAWVLNSLRYNLFGVVPGNASQNFWFNTTVFLPILILAVFLALLVNFRVIVYRSKRPDKMKKIISLVLTTPIVFLALIGIVFVVIELIYCM